MSTHPQSLRVNPVVGWRDYGNCGVAHHAGKYVSVILNKTETFFLKRLSDGFNTNTIINSGAYLFRTTPGGFAEEYCKFIDFFLDNGFLSKKEEHCFEDDFFSSTSERIFYLQERNISLKDLCQLVLEKTSIRIIKTISINGNGLLPLCYDLPALKNEGYLFLKIVDDGSFFDRGELFTFLEQAFEFGFVLDIETNFASAVNFEKAFNCASLRTSRVTMRFYDDNAFSHDQVMGENSFDKMVHSVLVFQHAGISVCIKSFSFWSDATRKKMENFARNFNCFLEE